SKVYQSEPLPASHAALLHPYVPEMTVRCKAQSLKGASGRTGYLSVAGSRLVFTYNTWSGSRLWELELRRIAAASLRRGVLMDVLELRYGDAGQRQQTTRFVFTRDRAPLAERFAARLGAVDTATGKRVAAT